MVVQTEAAAVLEALGLKSHFVEVAGQQMHYLDEGSGEAVILLHGNPTWCYMYRSLVFSLRGAMRVIAPDFIGCGLSSRPEGVKPYRALDRIEQLEEFVRRLGLERFSLVMHDWGGPIGCGMAVKNLEKVKRIVFLNTTLSDVRTLPRIIRQAALPIVGRFITQQTDQFLRLLLKFGVARHLDEKVWAAYRAPYRNSAARRAIWDFVADIPFKRAHPSFAALEWLRGSLSKLADHPIKVIWGLKDPVFHSGMLRALLDYFPRAEVTEIAAASHLVIEDAPEIVNAEIVEFLGRANAV